MGADQRVLHHRAVQRLVVAAGAAMARGDHAVGGGEQDAGAAGEVGDAQRRHRLGVGPVRVQPRHCEFGEQRRRRRQRVEGGEELAVGDQPPEHLAGEVLRAGHADPVQLVRDGAQALQHGRRHARPDRRQHVRGDAKDRPVVDLGEDVAPRLQYAVLRHPAELAAQFVDRGDAVGTRETGVERERVGDDRHRHPRGLLALLLPQRRGDPRPRVRLVLQPGAEAGGGLPDALLQDAHPFLDAAFGQRGLLDQAGERVDAATQPAGARPALRVGGLALAMREDAVAELRLGDALGEALLIAAQRRRHAHGDRLLDRLAVRVHDRVEAGARVVLDGRGGLPLGLDDHGRAAGMADHDVGSLGGMAAQDVGLLGADAPRLAPARVLPAQRLGERGVERGFAGARHRRQHTAGRAVRPPRPPVRRAVGRRRAVRWRAGRGRDSLGRWRTTCSRRRSVSCRR